MTLLADRIALVTGSTSGIGRGIARRFAALGAKVVVHGRDEAGASQTLEAIAGEGGEAAWFAADLADASACPAVVAFTVERFGVDICHEQIVYRQTFKGQNVRRHWWNKNCEPIQ